MADLSYRCDCDKCQILRRHIERPIDALRNTQTTDDVCVDCKVDLTVRNHFRCGDANDHHSLCIRCHFDAEPSADQHHISKQHVPACLWIFADNSNVFISAKQVARAHFNLAQNDATIRIDIRNYADAIVNMQTTQLRLGQAPRNYVSEPTKMDWSEFKRYGWETIVKQRRRSAAGEKELDTQLVYDVCKVVCDRSIPVGVVVIVSGDRDYFPLMATEAVAAVAANTKNNWKFQIWSWRAALSAHFESQENIEVVYLDEMMDQLLYCDYSGTSTWLQHEKLLKARTVFLVRPTVALRRQLCAHLASRRIAINCTNSLLNRIKKLIRRSFVAYFVERKNTINRNNVSSSRSAALDQQESDIAFVFGGDKSDPDSFINEIDHCFVGLQGIANEYCQQVMNYPDYEQTFGRPTLIDGRNEKYAFNTNDIGNDNCKTNDAAEDDDDELWETWPSADDDTVPNSPTWKIVKSRALKRQLKFSKQCPNHGKCEYKRRCYNTHTDDEMKYFENPCRFTPCPHMSDKRHNRNDCKFSHKRKEFFCRGCSKFGHEERNCKK